jgi:hypothetical protein
VPLSEEENRLLAQMEQALAAEDPSFAATLRGRSMERAAKVRAGGAVLSVIVGLVMLLGGAMAQQTWLGILGFVVMVAATTITLASWRGRQPARPTGVADHIIDGGFMKPRSREDEPPF